MCFSELLLLLNFLPWQKISHVCGTNKGSSYLITSYLTTVACSDLNRKSNREDFSSFSKDSFLLKSEKFQLIPSASGWGESQIHTHGLYSGLSYKDVCNQQNVESHKCFHSAGPQISVKTVATVIFSQSKEKEPPWNELKFLWVPTSAEPFYTSACCYCKNVQGQV